MNEPHEHRINVIDAVATITLDRPAAYNALTKRLLHSLIATLTACAADPAIRALVITGAGKGFCAGQALDDAETIGFDGTADLHSAVSEGFNPLVRTLLGMEKPIVAAVNGAAAGAGFGLALACDFRVVAQTATFSTAFVKIGLVADSGVSFLLPRMIGYAKALELCLLSEKLDAAAAQAFGLVTAVVPFAEVVVAAHKLAARLAAGPRAIGLMKRELFANTFGDIDAALQVEAELQSIAGATGDAREGVAAFRAKRSPVFAGR